MPFKNVNPVFKTFYITTVAFPDNCPSFLFFTSSDFPGKRGGNELGTETYAKNRDIGADCCPDEHFLPCKPGIVLPVIHTHQATKENIMGAIQPSGNSITSIEPDYFVQESFFFENVRNA